jgi:hypothetical protein
MPQILDELKQASKDQSKLGAKPHTDYSSHRWHQQLVDIRRDVTEMKTRRDNAAGPTMPPVRRKDTHHDSRKLTKPGIENF